MPEIQGLSIHISGVVQGVGFRPFVFSLAQRNGLSGWVRNTSAGVDIQVDGAYPALQAFLEGLKKDAPPLAHIDSITVQPCQPNGFTSFEIFHSQPIAQAYQPISPDVSICPDCLAELFNPDDRRFRYPFINCTNCGPRFTIIEDIPYDRPNTTMSGFPMCPECEAEYHDPGDRRFHAQPVACPTCGPQVWLEGSLSHPEILDSQSLQGEQAIQGAQRLLREGNILAIKGLGGFHLACDATNPLAVAELRRRKLRVDKPFALMLADLATVAAHCEVDQAEKELLQSRQRPIVILDRKAQSTIASQVAPGQDTLGVMLPYTPLHYLLFAGHQSERLAPNQPVALVMTSGNLCEEPIAIDNDEARQRLSPLADAFLMHDRPIRTRCDDSLVRVFQGIHLASSDPADDQHEPGATRPHLLQIRRSRGYAPLPVRLAWESPSVLATGGELKNVFAMTKGNYAFLSHHIGDMENFETLQSFEDGIRHFERLFRIQPVAIAYDLHPNYLATRYALERARQEGLPAFGVQHHHAHIASCMAEYGLPDDSPVIGVSFDGTGFGLDGTIWGGEFLLSTYREFKRAAHLSYFPLAGGDASVRKPARLALTYLWQTGMEWGAQLPSVRELSSEECSALRAQLEHHLNVIPNSSMGRLFDAVSALIGVRQKVNYEAQAAIELEALVDPREAGAYQFELISPGPGEVQTPIQINPKPVIREIMSDYRNEVSIANIAARFHNGISQMVLRICELISRNSSSRKVVLSGGVWQNMTLLNRTYQLLDSQGFQIYVHQQVPTNDGGLALGQAVIAAHLLTPVESLGGSNALQKVNF